MANFLAHPRELWWRKVLFQLHLWAGIFLGLYFVVIGLTGSLIVYKKELERAAIPQLIQVPVKAERASFQALYEAVWAAYPQASISNVFLYPEGVSWSFRLSENKERVQVYVNPYTAEVLGEDRYGGKFLQWVYDLHVNLLAGKTGVLLNGLGGFALALMSISGLVIWWPGLRFWKTGFVYAFRAHWKRQNYDVHKLVGLASAAILLLLGLTGSYWTWPKEYESFLAWATQGPAKTSAPRIAPIARKNWQDLESILQAARQALPEGEPSLFRFASRPDDVHSLKRILPTDWRTQGDDTVYLHPATAAVVHIDRHAEQALGVRLQRDIYALHFGTFGGHATRILWLLIGITPTVLFVSGLLMYWNRVLVKKQAGWNRPRLQRATSPLPEEVLR
ncbi:MAG: PepSY-associated TM helix domain-containing protein [Bryobacter sp.]|nr:PepSY-associated TM helix domain-containing protein [Bryobacter sp.]